MSKPCPHCNVTEAHLACAGRRGFARAQYHEQACPVRTNFRATQPEPEQCNCEQSQALQVQLDHALERGRIVLDHHHQMAQRHVEQIVALETARDFALAVPAHERGAELEYIREGRDIRQLFRRAGFTSLADLDEHWSGKG